MLRGVVFLIVACQGFLVMSEEVVLEEQDELDIVEENGQLYMEYTQVIEDLTSEYETISEHAEGVNLFMASLWESVENGQATVKIPAGIDPDESSIGIQDAIDTIDDMCGIDMTTVQRFLEKVQGLIAQMKNGTEAYKKLVEMKNNVDAMANIYTDVKRKVLEQRQSFTINELYEYLYVDDEQDPIFKSTEEDDDTAASIHQNFNMIPYGNDAHHDDDDDEDDNDDDHDMNSHQSSPEPSAQDQDPKPDPSTIPITTIRKAGDFPHVPIFAIVFIVLSIAVFILIAIVLCVCVTRKRMQEESPTPSLAEETKKEPISIITIPVDCHKPIQQINTEQTDLPCYLDVICDKM